MNKEVVVVGVGVTWWLLSLSVVVCQPISASPPPPLSTNQAEGGGVLLVHEVLAERQVYSYRSYKDVQIFHFLVPPHVTLSLFNFTANNSLACEPRNITVYLQPHSYPVINPDGAEYPPRLWVNRTRLHETYVQSDLKPVLVSVQYPVAGDWFMVAFINQASNRITQAGLFPSCRSWLGTKVVHHQEGDVVTVVPQIHSNQHIQLFQKIEYSQYYRFYVPSSTWMVKVHISNCSSQQEEGEGEGEETAPCPISIAFRPRALPHSHSIDSIFYNCSDENTGNHCTAEFIPEEEAWHYLQLVTLSQTSVQLNLSVKLQFCDEVSGRSKERFNTSDISSFNLINSTLSFLNDSDELVNSDGGGAVIPEEDVERERLLFVSQFDDNHLHSESCWQRYNLVKKTFGGNFVFEFDLPPDENGSVPLFIDVSNVTPTLLTFSLESATDVGGTLMVELAISPFVSTNNSHNISIAGCVTLGRREEPDSDGECVFGHELQVNTSSFMFKGASLSIPFPEPGLWYITLKPYCYLLTSSDVVECSEEETPILFHISSASCLDGKCGPYGSCYQYISGGFIFSTCVCDAGYRGWGCTDSAEATPRWKLLLSTLLLTLSNLFFLPAIILALKRRYFAESLVYAFTMLFSTFYHACDQEVYVFCLMRLSVLQFCDFYSAIFSFWVTLIAMADLHHSLYSLLHVAGAMIVALGVEYDRTGLWVFVVPSVSAFLVMASSWAWHCKQQRECYPSRHYWLTSLLPGVLLAAAGLICYAFFETHDNYYFVHSIWHATMALAIVCLLPPRRKKDEEEEEVLHVNNPTLITYTNLSSTLLHL